MWVLVFSVPDYNRVQVIDTVSQRVVQTIGTRQGRCCTWSSPARRIGGISCRDDSRVQVYDDAMPASCRPAWPWMRQRHLLHGTRAQRVGF